MQGHFKKKSTELNTYVSSSILLSKHDWVSIFFWLRLSGQSTKVYSQIRIYIDVSSLFLIIFTIRYFEKCNLMSKLWSVLSVSNMNQKSLRGKKKFQRKKKYSKKWSSRNWLYRRSSCISRLDCELVIRLITTNATCSNWRNDYGRELNRVIFEIKVVW